MMMELSDVYHANMLPHMMCKFCNEANELAREANEPKQFLPKIRIDADSLDLIKSDKVTKLFGVENKWYTQARYIEPNIVKILSSDGKWYIYRIVGQCPLRCLYHLEWVD